MAGQGGNGTRSQFPAAHMPVGLDRVPAGPVATGSGSLNRPLRRTTPSPQCQIERNGGESASVRSDHQEGAAATSWMIAGSGRSRAAPTTGPQDCR